MSLYTLNKSAVHLVVHNLVLSKGYKRSHHILNIAASDLDLSQEPCAVHNQQAIVYVMIAQHALNVKHNDGHM